MTQFQPVNPWMQRALKLASEAALRGEVPVGAVIVSGQEIISEASNRMVQSNDPTAHAEVIAIRQAAAKLGQQRLEQCDLYVTLEPCTMCAGAISHARLRRLYYAAQDPKGGAVENGVRFFNQPTCHHRPQVYDGLSASDASKMLKDFFESKR
jgi:tRNA(adenine34) deaminase